VTIEPGEDPFGFSASLALSSRVSEVRMDIALGHIVRRDGVDPVVLSRR
jgi:hypothetical protein